MNLTPTAVSDTTALPPAPVNAPRPRPRIEIFARDIKISHTVFALPFALLSTFIASGGWPRIGKLLLIVVCMVCGRTFAMAANRLLDAELDRRNPRTAGRAIPSGVVSKQYFLAAAGICTAGFFAACFGFQAIYRNLWPLVLATPVLLYLGCYPLLKRYTRLCHYYLGGALALAPVCAWLAVAGSLAAPPLWMAGAVLCWTAGFDIIYACQDYDSDVACGVFSVPSRLGIGPALLVARATHVVAVSMLLALGHSVPQFGAVYYSAVGIVVLLLLVEHSLVREGDLSKVGLAFFTVNGVVSVLLGTMGIVDLFI